MATAHLRYKLERLSPDGMKLKIAADQNLGPMVMRLGPLHKQPGASSVRVNGKIPAATAVQRSEKLLVVNYAVSPVGPVADVVKVSRE